MHLQYPNEDEILIPPLSYLEVIGEPFFMETEKGDVKVLLSELSLPRLPRASCARACWLFRVCSFVTSVGWECTSYQVYDARINCNLKSQVLLSALHVCAACARVWCGSDHTGPKGLARAVGCKAIYRSSSIYAHMISTATIR